jgi:hypothetical protein
MKKLIATFLVLAVWRVPLVIAQAPGDLHEIPVPGAASLRFRYCPPLSNARAGDPRKPITPTTPTFNLDGFFLCESEISREQFAALLGADALDVLHARMRLEQNPTPLTSGIDAPGAKRLPAVCTSFDEAAQVAETLQEIENRRLADLVHNQIRLPSHVEWQYACRSGNNELAHFSNWQVDWQAVLTFASGSGFEKQNAWLRNQIQGVTGKSSLQETAEAAWKAAGLESQGSFQGQQDQVVAILENFPDGGLMNGGPHHAIICSCLYQSIGVAHDVGVVQGPPSPLLPVGESDFETDWGLRHVQTNVTEWVFVPQVGQPLTEAWNDMLGQLRAPDENPENPKIATHGAHYISRDWVEFISWKYGMEPKPWQTVISDIKADDLDRFWCARQAGIRLLLKRSLADDWLAAVRRMALEAKGAQSADALSDAVGLVRQLSGENAAIDEARARFYESLAHARTGNIPLARQRLKTVADSTDAETSYFKHLVMAMALDESAGQ